MRTMAVLCAIAIVAGCSGELVPTSPVGSGPDSGTPGDSTVFRPSIQQDIDSLGCIVAACHGGDVAPMPLVANPGTDDDWEANYNQVMARAGTPATSLLIDKATGAGGHTAALDVSHPMLVRWREWIELGAPYQAAAGAPDAGTAGADGSPVVEVDAGAEITWDGDIQALMVSDGCTDCHGTQGAYSLESYSAALGFGSDATPNVIPGDPTSVLALYCEQGHYDMPYADTLIVLSWIVDFDARER